MVGPRLDDKNNVGFGVLWIVGNGVVFDADLMKTRQKKKTQIQKDNSNNGLY
jgi:hypothetical protein